MLSEPLVEVPPPPSTVFHSIVNWAIAAGAHSNTCMAAISAKKKRGILM